MAWLIPYLDQFHYIAICLVPFLAGLGVPIPEDIPLIYGGVLAGAGKINVWIHFVLSMIFILIGDSCLYFIGRRIGKVGEGTQEGPPSRWQRLLSPERRGKVEAYFDRYGSWTVFFGRFIAGVRGALYLTAGLTRFPFWRFLILDFFAALISVPLWIWLGYEAGANWETILAVVQSHVQQVIIGIVLVILLIVGFRWWLKRRSAEAP